MRALSVFFSIGEISSYDLKKRSVGDENAVAALFASFSMRGEALLWSHPYSSAAAGKLG